MPHAPPLLPPPDPTDRTRAAPAGVWYEACSSRSPPARGSLQPPARDAHMADQSEHDRKTARYGDAEVAAGTGGETHQAAGDDRPTMTTQQGIPVADDQNTLRVG